ncbi:MAG: AAA family ATPase [Lachnospiraceae bacterium]|nr:AAA family ATPase [Lachnospiraceae bacterium]
MSDTAESKKLLFQYTKARIPFIVVNTIEKDRALEILKSVSDEMQLPFCVSSLSKGIYDLASNRTIEDDPTFYGAIAYMSDQMRRRSNMTMILTEIPDISGDNADAKQLLATCNLANETSSEIIVLSDQPVWNQLQRLGMSVRIDLPTEEEMLQIIGEYINDYRGQIRIEWDYADVREAASVLTGVTRIEAENIMASLIAKEKILREDLDEIRSSKESMFSDISGLERIKVDPKDREVGGLDGLKSWLDEKKALMTPEKRDQLRSMGLRPPRGILLVGVPGCGKSLSAKSISASWKLPLYRLDFATVQGMYVGQSEQQLRDALATAEEVSPCILWIDEIEKGLSGAGSSNDGGVSTRMVGQFLFWLQECRKNVFVVATANDVSMLPSELLRRGRFDEMFFIDLPSSKERKDILALYMRKYLRLNFTGPLADRLVELSEGFTGADLESTVRDLAYRQISNPNFILNEQALLTAFNNVVPLSQTSPEKIEAIREWGRTRAVPASGRPIGEDKLSQRQGPKTRKVLLSNN